MAHYPERVSTGGLAGQGILNLLGRPHLNRVALVLREAAQNAWDARIRAPSTTSVPVSFGIRVRHLTSDQQSALATFLHEDSAVARSIPDNLADRLSRSDTIRVTEITDEGTLGLTGATRPDEPVPAGGSRFIDFVFDIGKAHAESGDGGTYGFGRAALYLASEANTIVVDSLTAEPGTSSRRLIGCRVGNAFDVHQGDVKGRFSGRHFWGDNSSGVVQPLTGDKAAQVAGALGLPARGGVATGTTILIPWVGPEWEDDRAIVEHLLRHLWPKMSPHNGNPSMRFTVAIGNRIVPVPDPSSLSEYRPFVRALDIARSRSASNGAQEMRILRPKVLTGYLGLSLSGAARDRITSQVGDEDSELVERPVNCVALMRPSELVVRYLPIRGTEGNSDNWAGAFVADASADIANAFAQSEPPAHDDWVPDRLPSSLARTIVKKTMKDRIPEAVRAFLGIGVRSPIASGDDGPSLARASARFSQSFLSGPGQMPGHDNGDAGRGGSSAGRAPSGRVRVSRPRCVAIVGREHHRVAIFSFVLAGPVGMSARVVAQPHIHAQASLDVPPTGMRAPTIVEWNGVHSTKQEQVFELAAPSVTCTVGVALWDDYAVALSCEIAV